MVQGPFSSSHSQSLTRRRTSAFASWRPGSSRRSAMPLYASSNRAWELACTHVLYGDLRLTAGLLSTPPSVCKPPVTYPTPPSPTSAARAPGFSHLSRNHVRMPGRSTKSASGANGTVEKASPLRFRAGQWLAKLYNFRFRCFLPVTCTDTVRAPARYAGTHVLCCTRPEIEVHHASRPAIRRWNGNVRIDGPVKYTRHARDGSAQVLLRSRDCFLPSMFTPTVPRARMYHIWSVSA
jgi:hypothetical protein